METGDKIIYYRAEVYTAERIETSIEEHEVIGINENHFCIDDNGFTTFVLTEKKSFSYSVLNKVSIIDWTEYKFFDRKFTVYIYTKDLSKRVVEGKMTRELRKFLDKKLSRYLFSTDIKISFKDGE